MNTILDALRPAFNGHNHCKQGWHVLMSVQTMKRKRSFLSLAKVQWEYFAQSQGIDVNMFGVFSEGSGKKGTFLSTEGARNDSNAVHSQLKYYLSTVCPHAGNGDDLYVHIDSCTGQNKNNIVHGYFMLLVLNGCHRSVTLKLWLSVTPNSVPTIYLGISGREWRLDKHFLFPNLPMKSSKRISSITCGSIWPCDAHGRLKKGYRAHL